MAYDEGGGPYEHVPPVPGHSNDNITDASLGTIPDISQIAVNRGSSFPNPVRAAWRHGTSQDCDLASTDPGGQLRRDAAAQRRLRSAVGVCACQTLSFHPFTRKHYVSHIPMDHTAVIKFVKAASSEAPLI